MSQQKRKKFTWNHISSKLTQPEISELKSYYQTYHKKFWGFKQAYKYYNKLRLIGNSLSVIFGVGGLASASTYMKYKNVDMNIESTRYAFQSYQHLLNQIKDMLRSHHYESITILHSMRSTDDFIIDTCPIVDTFLKKYDEKFTSQ